MKKEEKTQRTRERILAAGIEEFGKNGYRRGSINAISASDINKGLIYHNFKDIDDLYLACVKRSLDDMVAHIQEDMKDPAVDYSTARLHFFTEYEAEARLFLEASVSPPEHLKKEIQTLRQPLEDLNRSEFEKILQKQTLRKGISTEDAYRWFAYPDGTPFTRQLWFAYMEDAFNLSFDEYHSEDEDFSKRLQEHEQNAKALINIILYGIAEKKK